MPQDQNMRDQEMERLLRGQPPESEEILKKLTVGTGFLTDFLAKQYLEEYIPQGGSKLKFITGRSGAGKTHFSRLLLSEAKARGFITVRFSAREVWLHDFREIYLEILHQCDLDFILHRCAEKIIRDMGKDPAAIRPGQTFLDYLAEHREADAISKNTIRSALRDMFTRNPLLDNCFASCCSLLTGSILGHPVLEAADFDLLFAFLNGSREVKLSQLRSLGISPSRITRFNARHLLRSLSEVIHEAGFAGLMVVVDDMEVLLSANVQDPIRYSKGRREDAYESLRQLIDDIDSLRHLFWLCCFDRELIDNENAGIKSYQALWFRIQNEVISTRFNCFSDMLDLDRLADQCFSADLLIELSDNLASVLRSAGLKAEAITEKEAADALERAEFGGIGLPLLVNRAVVSRLEKATVEDTAMEGEEANA